MEDIRRLVDVFYGKIRVDDLLGGIFGGILKDNWQPHLDKMYSFWQSILLSEPTYNGRPFAPHARLPVERKHFDRWIVLFHQTVDDYFEGNNANFAKKQSVVMAEMFMKKISIFRNDPSAFIQ